MVAVAAIKELTTVEVDRSVKVCRDSRKRSQPILANIGHFLLLDGTVQLGVYRENGIFR